MPLVIKIVGQVLLLILAVWLIYRAYAANRKAEPLSLRAHLQSHHFAKGLNDMFVAGGFVLGAVLIVLLVVNWLTQLS
jgi:hypothetical protein